METLDLVRALYDYNEWANNELLSACEKLTPDEFSRPLGVSWDSIQTNLAHIVAAQVNWLSRWRTGANSQATTDLQAITGADKVRRAFEESHADLREFTSGLTDERLAATLTFKDSREKTFERVLWQLMLHVGNHGTYHRGEVAMALTGLGHNPGDLDYVFFELERDGRSR